VPVLTARDAYWQDPSRDMSELFDLVNSPSLHPPSPDNTLDWTQVLKPQTTSGLLTTAPSGVPWPQFLKSRPINRLRPNPGEGAGFLRPPRDNEPVFPQPDPASD
jgi:hypothetical protein